jgi:hypothetical protein
LTIDREARVLSLDGLWRGLRDLFRLLQGFYGVSQSLSGKLLGGRVIASAMDMGSGFMCVSRLGVEFRYM